MSFDDLTPEEMLEAMKKVHEWVHRVNRYRQEKAPILFPPLDMTKTGRFQSRVPNPVNIPVLPAKPMKVVSGRMMGKAQLSKVVVNRQNLKRALYGSLYSAPASAIATHSDVVVLPPSDSNIHLGYEEVCLSGCSQQLRCAGGQDLPVICRHCRSPGSFFRRVFPWIRIWASTHFELTFREEETLKLLLCDTEDAVPAACPLFHHSAVLCPRCGDRTESNPVRAIREQVSCWPRKRRQRNGRYLYRHNNLYLYGEPDGPTHTFKEWAVRCAGKGRGSLHDRQRQRHALRTERKKLGKDEKQQQAHRRSSRRSRKRKKAQR